MALAAETKKIVAQLDYADSDVNKGVQEFIRQMSMFSSPLYPIVGFQAIPVASYEAVPVHCTSILRFPPMACFLSAESYPTYPTSH